LSDSEEETFERKLARLRREAEELRVELEQRKQGDSSHTPTDQEGVTKGQPPEDGLLELSRALDNMYTSTQSRVSTGTALSADSSLLEKISTVSSAVLSSTDGTLSQTAVSQQPTNAFPITSPSSLLQNAASFDSRLTLVEAALGVSTSSNPFIPEPQTEDPPLQPVLPTLDHLASRLSALAGLLGTTASAFSTSSTNALTLSTNPNIEALSSRIKRLTVDAEALATARKRAIEASNRANAAITPSTTSSKLQDPPLDLSTSSSPTTVHTEPDAQNLSSHQQPQQQQEQQQQQQQQQQDEYTSKIHALYTTIPTIQSLHPLLPGVLDRLRSLRALHAGAATAAETLDFLEKRQAEMKSEIEQWKEGLKVVEEKVQAGEIAMKKNIDLVGPWVRELEKRLETLGV
jgi:nuclear migration protein JNM1